jgi:hypothetical protein
VTRSVACLSAGATLLASLAFGQAFSRSTGTNLSGETAFCLSWSKRNLTYRIDAAGSERTPADTEFAAIDAAYAAWQRLSNTCSDFQVLAGPLSQQPVVGKNPNAEAPIENVITFREKYCNTVVPPDDPCRSETEACRASPSGRCPIAKACANKYNCWDGAAGTIALTTATYSKITGIISKADIEFNAAQYLFTTVTGQPCPEGKLSTDCVAYDLQNVATHEIGHFFGFDHVDNATSTMAPSAILGDLQKRVIDLGTEEGFCQVYPAKGPPTICNDPNRLSSRITASPKGLVGCSAAHALFPVLLVVLLRQSKRLTARTS